MESCLQMYSLIIQWNNTVTFNRLDKVVTCAIEQVTQKEQENKEQNS